MRYSVIDEAGVARDGCGEGGGWRKNRVGFGLRSGKDACIRIRTTNDLTARSYTIYRAV